MKTIKALALFFTVLFIFSPICSIVVSSESSTVGWVNDVEPVKDYAYSFAVIGDTQSLLYHYPDNYPKLYDWITNNIESQKIKYVIGLGDITDKNTDTEWETAQATIRKLGESVPFSIVRGNHDGKSKYKKYFPFSEFGHTVDGSYDNTMLNTYKKFTVGNVKYMLVNLDVGAATSVLNWAGDIIKANPDYNVIITTHIYMNNKGLLIPKNQSSSYGPNGGEEMWDKLVSKYENIVMVLCGHVSYDHVVKAEMIGDNDNIVTQIMVDPQEVDRILGGVGLVAMLYFSEDGKNLDVRYYSTVRNKYFSPRSQFSTVLDLAGEKPEDTNNTPPGDIEVPLISKKPTAANTKPPTIFYNTSEDAYNSGNKSIFSYWYIFVIVIAAIATVVIMFVRKKKY